MESGVQPQPIGLSPEDRDALEAYTEEWISQCLDRDWDALVERLTDDVVFLPPDEPAVIGKAAGGRLSERLSDHNRVQRHHRERRRERRPCGDT